MRLIPLTQGKSAIVDDADYEWLMRWKWSYVANIYGFCYAKRNGPNGTSVLMHQSILALEDGRVVDHINLNTLDNQRANLRPATHSQNHANAPKRSGQYTSRYKGVSWSSARECWVAQIKVNYQGKFLGYFFSEVEAAAAYNVAALEAWGDFARTNRI